MPSAGLCMACPTLPRILKLGVSTCFVLMDPITWGVHALCRREDTATFIFPYHLRAVSVRAMVVKSPAGLTSCDIAKLPNCLLLQWIHLVWIPLCLWWTQTALQLEKLFIWVSRKIFVKYTSLYIHLLKYIQSQIPFCTITAILPQITYRSSWEYLSSLLIHLPGDPTSI